MREEEEKKRKRNGFVLIICVLVSGSNILNANLMCGRGECV